MAKQDNSIQMPGAFGGLMRYKEEYKSVISLKPSHVVGFIIIIILFVIFLNIFNPLA